MLNVYPVSGTTGGTRDRKAKQTKQNGFPTGAHRLLYPFSDHLNVNFKVNSTVWLRRSPSAFLPLPLQLSFLLQQHLMQAPSDPFSSPFSQWCPFKIHLFQETFFKHPHSQACCSLLCATMKPCMWNCGSLQQHSSWSLVTNESMTY